MLRFNSGNEVLKYCVDNKLNFSLGLMSPGGFEIILHKLEDKEYIIFPFASTFLREEDKVGERACVVTNKRIILASAWRGFGYFEYVNIPEITDVRILKSHKFGIGIVAVASNEEYFTINISKVYIKRFYSMLCQALATAGAKYQARSNKTNSLYANPPSFDGMSYRNEDYLLDKEMWLKIGKQIKDADDILDGVMLLCRNACIDRMLSH